MEKYIIMKTYEELEAEGKIFTDHSDTEVVLNDLSTQGPGLLKN